MEPNAPITTGSRGTEDAVFVSCAAMFALAIIFLTGALDTGRVTVVSIDAVANQGSVIQAVSQAPTPEPTIEEELNAVGDLLK